MRLPNGYGAVFKLSGKRRRPWAVRKCTGYLENGSPRYAYIGYYPTKAEALQALALYNRRPLDPEGMALTFGECFERWSAEKFPKLSPASVANYNVGFRLMCAPLADMRVKDIRLDDLQKIVNASPLTVSTGRRFRLVCGQIFEWAEAHEIAHDKTAMLKHLDLSGMRAASSRKAARITPEEIASLWARKDDRTVQMILCLIYTGLRISELLDMPADAVHDDYLEVRAAKTAAGVRVVPIADKIRPFIAPSDKYAFPRPDGSKWHYRAFLPAFYPLLPGHRVHDTRHTCISMLTEAGVDSRIIKAIVGHTGEGVTEQVYTHISMEAKLNAINRI